MFVAPASGVRLVIVRELLPVQETSLRNQGRFYPEVHEDAFDYEMMLIQQVANSVGSSDGSSRLLALGVADTDGDGAYRAKGNRIVNVGDPVNENDVTRLKDIKPFADSANAAQQAAEAAQAAAEDAKAAAAQSAVDAAASAAQIDPSTYYTKMETDGRIGELKQVSILTSPTVPASKQGDLIYVDPFGLMLWNETHGMYRSIECGRKVNGWSKNVLPGYVEANGATYSKNGNYKGLWTAVQDNDLVIAPAGFLAGQFLFVNVDADNFRVPDLRGYFDRNTEISGRAQFSAQDWAIQNIVGAVGIGESSYATGAFQLGSWSPSGNTAPAYGSDLFASFDASRVVKAASETRPMNTAFPAWIKL